LGVWKSSSQNRTDGGEDHLDLRCALPPEHLVEALHPQPAVEPVSKLRMALLLFLGRGGPVSMGSIDPILDCTGILRNPQLHFASRWWNLVWIGATRFAAVPL